MKRKFIVVSPAGDLSYLDGDVEHFSTFKAARARAERLAAEAPGQTFDIFELTARAVAEAKPVVVSRIHPIEHYK
jgi:hypothetical protein